MGLIHIDLFTTLDGVAQAPLLGEVVGEQVDSGWTLFAVRLFDQLTLWVYPILLGGAKTVFADAVLQRYALADGTPGVGDMSAGDPEGQVEVAFDDIRRNTP
ncbi:hypothetical protein [Pseudarthrobacter sp. Y6]|uniref:hypothetical protein n=1 Tax=Pseudarthrobacter sp. Y6 TaxID=3418422 RepID=UPI003CF026F2